jgi:hypothetical protein
VTSVGNLSELDRKEIFADIYFVHERRTDVIIKKKWRIETGIFRVKNRGCRGPAAYKARPVAFHVFR